MPPRKRRSFTAEHKVEAAHQVIESGRAIAEVARELGLNESLLGEWVKSRAAQDHRRRGPRRPTPGPSRTRRAAVPAPAGQQLEKRFPGKSFGWGARPGRSPQGNFAAMQKNRPGSI
ncbi:transposase [Rhodococcus sp. F64268]|uniref:transposase n=1 Tax=Rhodococcus sp. F64268 TaxID=2926402 RepID=UPI0035B1E571